MQYNTFYIKEEKVSGSALPVLIVHCKKLDFRIKVWAWKTWEQLGRDKQPIQDNYVSFSNITMLSKLNF